MDDYKIKAAWEYRQKTTPGTYGDIEVLIKNNHMHLIIKVLKIKVFAFTLGQGDGIWIHKGKWINTLNKMCDEYDAYIENERFNEAKILEGYEMSYDITAREIGDIDIIIQNERVNKNGSKPLTDKEANKILNDIFIEACNKARLNLITAKELNHLNQEKEERFYISPIDWRASIHTKDTIEILNGFVDPNNPYQVKIT